ncbi:hypothetical protein CPAR01_09868 [Colletotrichum paranaense]|uniref:Uncharacterized protein n=6 Tax=Colletotrichum acutatum species complex TaxID=2707335 RepID=A0A9Q0AYI5_9PEZI|nr:uncharacterized protein CCOS01_14205 [Colletotrichum costaricense]XP_060346314.1 uncharacterized protein CPAR01_09868 [Colletotrichum paranaense]XP_060377628.1 uncharacterized protein CTAM01_11714 [Colletotrichum tamarilloi]XP_060390885.1 uncharacterized protein CABS01_15860 [Colletotrichum abscissum]KAI3530334.1 hypothetical protein CSPX01_14916 [Colletotrichum filicis]KAK0376265.1 hypothetical protein CLIM01_06391 [Colletotrichum limetticola]KAK1458269.1 hypothetical protein CMEL01_15616
MLYSKLFVAALTGISCVAAMPAEQPAELAKAEAFPRGECRDERDELYCGRSVKEFTRYDAKNRLCFANDGGNRLFCAIREQQELAIELAREFDRITRCEIDQYYGYRERRCECYRRRDGDRGGRGRECRDGDRDGDRRGGRDGDRDGDRGRGGRDGDRGRDDHDPNCKGDDLAFCAASEDLIITYERGAEICDRNRGNYVFCANRERGAARDKARDHFRDRNKKQA